MISPESGDKRIPNNLLPSKAGKFTTRDDHLYTTIRRTPPPHEASPLPPVGARREVLGKYNIIILKPGMWDLKVKAMAYNNLRENIKKLRTK